MKLDRRTQFFVFLVGVFVTSLVMGDILGGKLTEVTLLGRTQIVSVGMIPFPVTFLLTDLLNEFYGKKAARFVTLVGFFMALFTYVLILLSASLPWASLAREPGWTGMTEGAFQSVFLSSQRILLASMVAYLLGQFLDIGVFHLLKRLTHNRLLWLRATGSTLISQLIDTFVIQLLAWSGTLTGAKLLELVATGYTIKVFAAIGLTPLIYAGHVLVQRVLGFAPVLLDEHGDPLPEEQPLERENSAS
ncbi:MAG: queuosine precursor transporter [Myxococcales bacterium]|nr:queuosine precursor transporter [Polyangiaceae bacterium]MDW8249434.1 queuosine precursor transporter [Myxococcales bacterium]